MELQPKWVQVTEFELYNVSGGGSKHGAAGGSYHGTTDCAGPLYGSGGGGEYGGAGGSYIEITAGTVSIAFVLSPCHLDSTDILSLMLSTQLSICPV